MKQQTLFGRPIVECEDVDCEEVLVVGYRSRIPVDVEIVPGDPPTIKMTVAENKADYRRA